MTGSTMRAAGLALAISVGLASAGAAHAESMKECSVKYQAAKKSGTLNGADWKSFRAAQCGSGAPMAKTDAGVASDSGASGAGKSAPVASAAPATAAPAASTSAPSTAAAPPAAAASNAPAASPPAATPSGPGKTPSAAAPVASGNVVFPSAVNAKYAGLSAGKARMKSCVDQYKLNKASGGNGGLKWIQKGGGYYSECSKKLKGA